MNKGNNPQEPDSKPLEPDVKEERKSFLMIPEEFANRIENLEDEMKDFRNIKREMAEFIFQFIAIFFGIIGIIIAILATNSDYFIFISSQSYLVFWLLFGILLIWFLTWSIPKYLNYRDKKSVELQRKSNIKDFEAIVRRILEEYDIQLKKQKK